jgi:hypothetical protein
MMEKLQPFRFLNHPRHQDGDMRKERYYHKFYNRQEGG